MSEDVGNLVAASPWHSLAMGGRSWLLLIGNRWRFEEQLLLNFLNPSSHPLVTTMQGKQRQQQSRQQQQIQRRSRRSLSSTSETPPLINKRLTTTAIVPSMALPVVEHHWCWCWWFGKQKQLLERESLEKCSNSVLLVMGGGGAYLCNTGWVPKA